MNTVLITTLVFAFSPLVPAATSASDTIRGKKAAKTAKALEKAGVETEEGMGRSRLSAAITCYKDRGYWCDVEDIPLTRQNGRDTRRHGMHAMPR